MAEAAKQKKTVTATFKVKINNIDQSLKEAPVLFVDGAHGNIITEDIAKINFYQDRMRSMIGDTSEKQIERIVCLRLIMTNRTLVQFYDWLKPTVDFIRPRLTNQDSSDEAESDG